MGIAAYQLALILSVILRDSLNQNVENTGESVKTISQDDED